MVIRYGNLESVISNHCIKGGPLNAWHIKRIPVEYRHRLREIQMADQYLDRLSVAHRRLMLRVDVWQRTGRWITRD